MRDRISNPETAAFALHSCWHRRRVRRKPTPDCCFITPNRSGFDIVIGNPPYESVNKDQQAPRNADRAERRAWADRGQARRHLESEKRYRTTAGNAPYNLVADAALPLAKTAGA